MIMAWIGEITEATVAAAAAVQSVEVATWGGGGREGMEGEEKVIGREMVVQGRFWRGGCRRESNGKVNGRQSREVLPRWLQFLFNG